ncbi:MAG: LTA synthase family protein [Erysipelotrichaceae bacterium]
MRKFLNSKLFLGILYVLCFISIELLFRWFNLFNIYDAHVVRILIFSLSVSLGIFVVSSLLPKKSQLFLLNFSLFFLAFIALTQVSYRLYMNANYSFRLFFSMASRVNDYASDFTKYIKLENCIVFIPFIIFLVFSIKLSKNHTERLNWKKLIFPTVLVFLIHFVGILSLNWFNQETLPIKVRELYDNPYIADLSLNQLGLSRFIIRDTRNLLLGTKESEEIIEIIPEEVVVISEPSYERVIDDQAWIDKMNNESNETIKIIDEYLMNRPITPRNEYTGLFKNKNLVYIMVEAFDFMAIDEQLTPILYKMSQDGFYFDHFFSPQYSCATGESEFIGLTSLIPRTGICSPNTYTNNTYKTSIFNLFNEEGYFSSSYHNYSDKFYQRTELHVNLGSTKFYNNDDLEIKTLKGWPSDVNLMEEAFKVYGNQEKFFSYIITSSTHFPYDIDSTLGNRYIEQISAIYPDLPMNVMRYKSKAMELDKSIETLMNLLDAQGILDDTVIILYGDHFPLKTEKQVFLDYGDPYQNRSQGFNMNILPMIIYNSEVKGSQISKVSSTFDLVPTIANLFDLDYDPRFYFGVDIFDTTQERVVPYASLSWNNELGAYSVASAKFFPFDENNTLTQEEITRISKIIKQNSDISYRLLKNDYFSYR